MTRPDDPRLQDTKAIPMRELVDRLGIAGLRQNGAEMSGPCPLCGSVGHNPKSGPVNRFNINMQTGAFLCRKCDLRGGDQVALIMGVMGLDFRAALDWACGAAPVMRDPQEMARARKAAAEAERAQRAATERYRRRAIEDARQIWDRSRPGHLGVVAAYLAARNLPIDLFDTFPQDLNFIACHPYRKKLGNQWVTPHEGPAMVAAIRRPDGQVSAVHQTWVDAQPPHGKARICHGAQTLPAKLVRGSKKGGAIRLVTPDRFDTLVMGEGIETTLTAAAGWRAALDPSRTAYWAGVDLGNMAGRMQRVPGQRHSGLPDMADPDAFVPPPWLRRLIFIQDGDSDAVATRAKLLSGLRRAMAFNPNLNTQIVHAGQGVDLNDILSGPACDVPKEPAHD